MNKTFEIIGIDILHQEQSFYGADQYWYKRKLHAMSGCGPTTAAVALAYLAQSVEGCSGLYPYNAPFTKDDFLCHMEDVRLAIKPRFGPMTDPDVFGSKCVEYAKSKSVDISYRVMDKTFDTQKVFERIIQLIDNNILPSLLIMRNPHKEIDEFTWHWMSVTGYKRDSNEIIIATYGKRYVLDFAKVWEQGGRFSADLVWFLCAGHERRAAI